MKKYKYCTQENPFKQEKLEKEDFWIHEKSHEVGEQIDGYPGGDIITLQCEICGTKWTEELPQ